MDPLTRPGLTDITANVDFASLRKAMDPYSLSFILKTLSRKKNKFTFDLIQSWRCSPTASTYGPITQREFLLRMGIELRASRLRGSRSSEVDSAVDRLVSPLGMGNEYKVLGLESSKNGCQTDLYPFLKA